MSPMKEYYAKQAQTLLPNLKKRQMEGYYFDTLTEAKEFIYNTFLRPGMTIGFGGSMTFEKESSLYDELKQDPQYHLIDRKDKDIPLPELNAQLINADVFFLSANAISLDGQLINIDGRGNRLSFLLYGPESIIVLVGMNKVESTLEAALHRARNVAAPKNSMRLQRNTPCTIKGYCMDCLSPDCICSNIVITRRSYVPNRIKVVLVGEELGY